jgi:1-acyl-sn-glycerol-3-phosphate acyltransferase
VLLISNHKCDLDYVFVWALAARIGALQPGHFCAVAKGALRRVPLFGWLFKVVGFLFLARAWEADRHRMGVWAATAVRHVRPMWLLLYPEGTRFTARAKAGSDAAAAKAGVPPLGCELLLPRPKGFVTLAAALAPRFRSVLDCTIAYVGADGALMGWNQLGTSAITALAGGRLALSRVEVHVELLPFASLPQGEEGLTAWLNARWRRKEELLKHAQAHGAFPGARAGSDAPVPAGRTACAAAIFAAGIVALVHLLRASAAFRMCVRVLLCVKCESVRAADARCSSPLGTCSSPASRWRSSPTRTRPSGEAQGLACKQSELCCCIGESVLRVSLRFARCSSTCAARVQAREARSGCKACRARGTRAAGTRAAEVACPVSCPTELRTVPNPGFFH